MKSQNAMVVIALVFLLIAVVTSVVIWPGVSTAAKIAFFAFGFGVGILAGVWIARRRA